MRLILEEIETGLGTVLLVSDDDDALRALQFDDCPKRLCTKLAERFPGYRLEGREAVSENAARVRAYAAGDVRAFDGALLRPNGTPFQNRVWSELCRIPAGTTSTYGAVAAAVGRRGAARAVGAANHLNPIAIAIPCHRVIGSNGSLTGYAGGVERKRRLLEHEFKWTAASRFDTDDIGATLELPFPQDFAHPRVLRTSERVATRAPRREQQE